MGNSESSFEDQLRKRTSTINSLHNDIDASMTRIENEANRLIGLITQRNYTDRVQLCQQLGWQKVDELSGLLPIETLQGIRYRLGIIPENTEQLNQTKQSICKDIVNFYLKKVNLISNIQAELPKCREMENAIYTGLTRRLQSEDVDNDEWIRIYNKLEKFNKDIRKRYALFERELVRIRKARTIRELDAIEVTTNSIVAKTNNICKNYEYDLIRFSRKSEKVRSDQPLKPVPKEPTMTTVVRQQPIVREVRQQVPVVQRVVQEPVVVRQEVVRKPVKPLPTKPIPIPQSPDVRSREVLVEGERIRREPNRLVVENPTKVQVTRNVSPKLARRIQQTLIPGERVVKIEPLATSSVPTENIPARAIASWNARNSNEVNLTNGELVLHITNERGWALVKKSNGQEGYVPLSYLSQ